MGTLLRAGLRLREWRHDVRFERATAGPARAQATALQALLQRDARTAFGREHSFVEVRGYHHRTPLVAFVRKGRDTTSITGEKLHLNHVRAAVRAAEDATQVEVWQFRLIPDVETCR